MELTRQQKKALVRKWQEVQAQRRQWFAKYCQLYANDRPAAIAFAEDGLAQLSAEEIVWRVNALWHGRI